MALALLTRGTFIGGSIPPRASNSFPSANSFEPLRLFRDFCLNPALENVLKCLALLSSGLFAGAGFYLSTVEHPARISAGASVAPREFGPSCKRAPLHQAVLAIVCFVCGVSLALMATNPLLLDRSEERRVGKE